MVNSAAVMSVVTLVSYICVGSVVAAAISLHKKPAPAVAWVLLLFFMPILGLVIFLVFGFGRLPQHRREKQRIVNEMVLAEPARRARAVQPTSPAWLGSAVVLNQTLGSLPMVAGTTVSLIEGYRQAIDEIAADIDKARDYVHVEYYILSDDDTTRPFFAALERATARGVRVRVLSDHLAGKGIPSRKRTKRTLDAAGAQWWPMLPVRPLRGQWQRPDMRNHRKLVVIDGQVGYTGSQNMIADDYLKKSNIRRGLHWKELVIRVEGPAVSELDAVFVSDWFSETNEMLPLVTPDAPVNEEVASSAMPTVANVDTQVVPSGPNFENDNNLKLFVILIHNARKRISITSPYFVPDETTLMALVTAASRGVEVELFVSEVADQFLVYHAQRSYYSALMAAGVTIYQYRAPSVLHAKHFSIDDEVSVVGSSNMDIRSFSLNMEVSVLLRSKEFSRRLREVEDHHRNESTALDPHAWAQRSWVGKIFDGLARLASALL